MHGRVVFNFLRSDEDYRVGSVEAVAADAAEPNAAEISASLVLNEEAANSIAKRWLHEARVSQETIQFDLPIAWQLLNAGDVVEIADGGNAICSRFRIDRIDDGRIRSIRATRIDEALFLQAPLEDSRRPGFHAIKAPSAAHAEILDVPLLRGAEKPHAPTFAVVKKPWSAPVAFFGSQGDNDWAPIGQALRPATIGRLLDPLPAGSPGLWMRRSARIELEAGVLASRSEAAVLGGANAALLHASGSTTCEVVQFRDADLVAPNTYLVGRWLRGQVGTDAVMPTLWPPGTSFVLVDDALGQLDVPPSALGSAISIRYGASEDAISASSFRNAEVTLSGAGLRPYSVAHLRGKRNSDGGVEISWIRRTRVGGDTWDSEVPLGEESAIFVVEVFKSGKSLFKEIIHNSYYYLELKDHVSSELPLEICVAQVSALFGIGPFQRIIVNE